MMSTGGKRLRRTTMFPNAQKPELIKDPYTYRPDSVMPDLEDAVAGNQKGAARFSLYRTLKTIDYQGCEGVVRIDGLGTPYWKEDIRCAAAGGRDAIRIPKTERPEGVRTVEGHTEATGKEFDIPEGRTLITATIESIKEVMETLDIYEVSGRPFDITLSGGDYAKDLQIHIIGTGIELTDARQNTIITARAAGVQCFDTVYTNLGGMEGFRRDVGTIHLMRFDGKSTTNPKQITAVHEIFTPTLKDIIFAEKVVKETDDKRARGIDVFTVNGKMINITFCGGARRIIIPAKASGVYKGGL